MSRIRNKDWRWAEILELKQLYLNTHIWSYLQSDLDKTAHNASTHAHFHTLHTLIQAHYTYSRTYRHIVRMYVRSRRHTCSYLSSSSHFQIQISLELNSHLGESNKVSLFHLSLLSRSRLVDFSLITSQTLCVLAYARPCNQLVSYFTVSLVNINVTKGPGYHKEAFNLKGDSL